MKADSDANHAAGASGAGLGNGRCAFARGVAALILRQSYRPDLPASLQFSHLVSMTSSGEPERSMAADHEHFLFPRIQFIRDFLHRFSADFFNRP